jgi:hypothetical protein
MQIFMGRDSIHFVDIGRIFPYGTSRQQGVTSRLLLLPIEEMAKLTRLPNKSAAPGVRIAPVSNCDAPQPNHKAKAAREINFQK